jgi:hypothetical protein
MKKIILLLLLSGGHLTASSQELYVFSEPASNMPSGTLSPKIKAVLGKQSDGSVFQRYTPELMWGLHKKWLVHLAGTFSNMFSEQLRWEGGYLYAKYRFYSVDEVHKHFRLAAFAETGYTRNPVYFEDISVRGDNTGIDLGLIATQLQNKLAVSATGSFTRLFTYNSELYRIDRQALNYSLSAGYLILPAVYSDFQQLNLNVYMELVGQKTLGRGRYYLDAAPALQLLFNSNSKLNVGYRFQLTGNALRSVERSYLVSFEHTFFNVLRKNRN